MFSAPRVTEGVFLCLTTTGMTPEFTAEITMAFKKGHDANRAKGGSREGAGRTPDWLREKCREIIEKEKLIDFMGDVAAGKEFPQLATGEGEVLPLPPSIKDRRAAAEWLVDRGYGKVAQQITGEDGGPITIKVIQYS